ncbi:hypothetical protein LJR245_007461 [Rhizobium leguminosarum]|uniref:hypothetical protein n=1 Tax=Rhizobium leguminosarum TaxID=384 RepID=UPI003ECFB0AF
MRKRYSGLISFSVLSIAILVQIGSASLEGGLGEWSLRVAALLSIPILFYIVAAYIRYRKWAGAGVVASIGPLASSAGLFVVNVPLPLIGVLSFLTIVTMLTTARVELVAYAMLCVVAGVIVGLETGDVYFAVGGTLAFALMLFATNYAVQLVIDHSNERAQLFKMRKQLSIAGLTKLVFAFWLPTVALVIIGIFINHAVQSKLLDAVYDSGVIQSAPGEDAQKGSKLQRDVYYTID